MKPIEELRKNLPDRLELVSSSIKYFSKNNIDYDVFLPSIKMNLQRGFVWTLEQKQELIWSIFYGRNIPPLSFVNTFYDCWEVIDGKQRLSTYIEFYQNKFQLEVDGTLYYYSELPIDYIREIKRFYFKYYVAFETKESEFDDQFKINWFRFINFAGTPQDSEHLKKLSGLI